MSTMDRPKSSIPTFSEIKERVSKQMAKNPDWDPNTELPSEDIDMAKRAAVPAWSEDWEEKSTTSSRQAFFPTQTLHCPLHY